MILISEEVGSAVPHPHCVKMQTVARVQPKAVATKGEPPSAKNFYCPCPSLEPH